jgi:PHP domain
MAEFTHLHLHTDYSLLDGACDVEKLVAHVDSIGQKAGAITDHGNIYGAVHFFEAAKAKGIKLILGCELYICPQDNCFLLSTTLSYLSSRLPRRAVGQERTRISCHAAPDKTAYAPFFKERRMVFANATNFYRKSGGAEGRDPRCAIRMPHIYRSAPLSPLSTRGNRTHRTLISEHEELAASKNPRQQFHSRFSSICTSSAHRRRPQY